MSYSVRGEQNRQERYDEFNAKLKAIDAEIQSIREQYRSDAASSRLRLMSDAQRIAGRRLQILGQMRNPWLLISRAKWCQRWVCGFLPAPRPSLRIA